MPLIRNELVWLFSDSDGICQTLCFAEGEGSVCASRAHLAMQGSSRVKLGNTGQLSAVLFTI